MLVLLIIYLEGFWCTYIDSLSDLCAVGVNPHGPGIRTSNRNASGAQRNLDHSLDVVDLLGKIVTGDLLAVKRLGANIDPGKPLRAMSPDSGLKGILLGSELVGINSPNTSPDLGTDVLRGRDSVLEGVAIAGGEELEGSVLRAPGHNRGEIGLPVGGSFAAAVRL